MEGFGEHAPVHGGEDRGPEIRGGLDGLLRGHVHPGPALVVLAALEEGEVEGTEPAADLREVGAGAAV